MNDEVEIEYMKFLKGRTENSCIVDIEINDLQIILIFIRYLTWQLCPRGIPEMKRLSFDPDQIFGIKGIQQKVHSSGPIKHWFTDLEYKNNIWQDEKEKEENGEQGI